MGATSSLDLMTTRFESGMPRLVQQLVIRWRGIPRGCCPLLLPLPMGSTPFLDLMATPSVWGNHFRVNHPALVIRFMLVYVHDLTHRVGSEIQTAAYSIGYL